MSITLTVLTTAAALLAAQHVHHRLGFRRPELPTSIPRELAALTAAVLLWLLLTTGQAALISPTPAPTVNPPPPPPFLAPYPPTL